MSKSLGGHPLVQLTLLRCREFIREPEAVFWALIFPVLLAGGLGIAFRGESVEAVRVTVTDAALVTSLSGDGGIDAVVMSPADAAVALQTGRTLLVVDRAAGGSVTYHYDDTNPQARAARSAVNQALQVASGRTDPVPVGDVITREPGSRYIDFLIPGLVGMGIMGNAIWGLGFSIVDARRRKLMKRIVATPMPRHYFLGSFLAWRIVLLPVEVGVPIVFGRLVFGVPFRGGLIDLIVICVAGSMAFSAIGLLLASRAKTIEAVSGLMNFVMMPMWIVSGVFFSADRFPDAIQPLIQALPLSALITAIRANMLLGDPLTAAWPQLATLAAWLLGAFAVAMRLFRWR